eukprot:gene3105-6095_t
MQEREQQERHSELLVEATSLVDACGLDDPLQKLMWDSSLGTLTRRKAKYPLDGVPLAAGIACLLKQFHPECTRQCLAYLRQYVQNILNQVLRSAETSGNVKKGGEIPTDVLNHIVFMDLLCQYTSSPRDALSDLISSSAMS